ncbi:hypothetical protein AB0I77_15760 [Streptomyces sp. NPDC050619]|uniref:hypothetical protein n=1 Tax=Streptomyces sp. NPDC050619 TaxID=3157214 RepID=UPI0034266BA0
MQNTEAPAQQSPRRAAWNRLGTIVIPDVLSADRFTAIKSEAAERLDKATPHVHDHTAAHRDGSFATPVHCAFIEPGPALETLAYDKELLSAVREHTGIPRLVPRGGAVVRYREGDFQGLHLDSIKSTVTAAFALTEDLPAMGWAPHLYNASGEVLGKVVADHGMFPEGGEFTTLEHPYGGEGAVRAFAGYGVPHWRRPMTGEGLLVTMEFFDL